MSRHSELAQTGPRAGSHRRELQSKPDAGLNRPGFMRADRPAPQLRCEL